MPRYALKVEYHGQPFSGWQRQKDRPSVQQVLEGALTKLDDSRPSVTGSGRTDAGVHATGQIAHFDLTKEWDAFRLSEALNYHMKPAPVAIVDTALVADDFHARFDAVQRHYLFRVISRRAPMTLDKGLVWQVNRDLDMDAMREAASHLIGTHDFTTFRSTLCQAKSPIRTLDDLRIEAFEGEDQIEYRFHVVARSFLHNQVRSFVGTLERVGVGAWSADQVRYALNAQDRTECGPVCPPQGLYLSKVIYPEDPFAVDRDRA